MEALAERVHCALRGDINTIVGYCEMLLEEVDDSSVSEDLAKIRLSATRLVDLIQGIVDYAGVVSGSEPLISDAASTDTRVQDIAENLRQFDARHARESEEPGRLLVVDDNELNRDILARQLSRDGHEVALASGGREALQHLADHDVELVLLDLFMPDIDGYEVLERMKADSRWQQIPVIVLSAGGNTDGFVRCIEAGAEDYLAKPANPVLLRSRTSASLERKRLRDREKEYLEQIRIERDKSDKLLLNILPVPIAERLKAGEETIADAVNDATVLFCDVVGFTTMSARLSPKVIVGRLNKIFRAFDALAAKHGVEKIKTIGDAYMAVAGVPVEAEDHAERVTDLAIDMLAAVDTYSREESEPLQVRIGINSGPVVAGVIGTAKFAYDLWGDTVNTASRMESSGEPGKIQISASARQRLNDHYELDERGTIEFKGKGPMETYFVLGRRESGG
jgi:adenylate cyclase